MDGRPKFLIELGNKTLLAHVIARLHPQVGEILLNINDPCESLPASGFAVRRDSVAGYAGPLAGILAGFDYFREQGFSVGHMLTLPVDTPFLPDDLAARLLGAAEKAGDAIIMACSGGQLHPVIGLWPFALCEDLRAALTVDGVRKIRDFAAAHGVREVEWAVDGGDPFFNVNRPEDLAAAERRLLAMRS